MLSKKKGFTLVEIMIVVAIIGILVAIAIPGFLRARTTAQTNACQENLTKIDGAKTQWALDMKKSTGATVDLATLAPADGTGWLASEPSCPGGGAYTVGAIGTDPTCSIADHVLP